LPTPPPPPLFPYTTLFRSVVDYWVGAVPTTWNIAPNGIDPIHGTAIDPADSIFPTVVYRRFTPQWRRQIANASRSSADGLSIPRSEEHTSELQSLRHLVCR